ncbi:MAG: lanthionine synthetase C family protein [Deltaproteobacteria bacterium]|nr:lanthionine synthetase C family protein [Deltaproteobacteria bacterium]
MREALQSMPCVPVRLAPTPANPFAEPDASLPGGAAGFATFYAYLAQADPEHGDLEYVEHYLGTATEALVEHPMAIHLHGGFTGIAWAHCHLARCVDAVDFVDVDELASIDQAVLSVLSAPRWVGDYDVVGGIVGLGVYGLERGDAIGRSIVAEVVRHLATTATVDQHGARWITPAENLPPWQREYAPEGYVNLGLAHGVPGVIALLARAITDDIAVERARPLLDDAVRWLLAQRGEDRGTSVFPTWVVPGEGRPLRPRTAWCYGDAGVAIALAGAAAATADPRWRAAAMELTDAMIERAPTACRIYDASLCHGAVGMAHVLARLSRALGEPRYAEAARYWYGEVLDAHQPDRPRGGFPFATFDAQGERAWRDDPGLLTGAAGVGLGLLAAVSDHAPAWDRCLLMS